ncbi:MAG: hypothetical protein M0R28_20310 [Pigmentiphaga sp.]|nr:hypothetical protein [Pigmentiphaga sp.]
MTPLQLMQALGINPAPTTHAEYLDSWLKIKDIAKSLSDTEMTMRKALFAATFPDPKEGANNFILPDGRKLAATHKINRSIDEALIQPTRAEYELLNDRPVAFDELLKVKHELVTSAFRKLQPAKDEALGPAYAVISKMITAKPGAPTMEVKG